MANEITTTSGAALLITANLNRMLYELIADRTDIRQAVYFVDDPQDSGSAGVKLPQVQFDEVMAATGEASAVVNSALGTGSLTLTAARQALSYESSDLFQLVSGNVDLSRLAAGGAQAGIRRAAAMIMTIAATATASVGTPAVDLNVDTFYAAQFQLIDSNADGDVYCVLEPHQFTEFQNSLRGESGAVQFVPATAEMLRFKGRGFKGEFSGIPIWTTNQVTNDGTDYFGGMWCAGGIAGLELTPKLDQGTIPLSPFLSVAVPESPMFVELERTAKSALTAVVANYYCAYGLNEDAKVCEIRSAV